ncbi:MAG: response regulator [Saprospiraceae bacterium]
MVEDDPDDIDLLQAAMKKVQVPFRINTCMQGDNVLPHLTTLTRLPDVIVLDLNLPRMHGREVLQLLKTSPSFQSIPVVILTTSSSLADREFCQQAGAKVFLTKPTTVEGFQAITQAILLAAS